MDGKLSRHPVHPRAGGEHAIASTSRRFCGGSSPRGRGTRESPNCKWLELRFIPARAGNTGSSQPAARIPAVHPRAGGEHYPFPMLNGIYHGSSPRGRGTLLFSLPCIPFIRFIPARAGNTLALVGSRRMDAVHPRAGGEHDCGYDVTQQSLGSSPRGRGTLLYMLYITNEKRFIPARAGNTFGYAISAIVKSVHPRAGGEHRIRLKVQFEFYGSSPRGRGTLSVIRYDAGPSRFIPARAGNTTDSYCQR